MNTGFGGIFAIAISGTLLVALVFTLSVSTFLRETSGDQERWQSQTAQGRSGLANTAGDLGLPGNNPGRPDLPPDGDEDGDGVPNGEDPDPTNPNNPNPAPNRFNIDTIEKFVIKDARLSKSTKVPIYSQSLFAIHLEFTNDASSRIVRVTDFGELNDLTGDPTPILCLTGQESLPFEDDFCEDSPGLAPDRIEDGNGYPVWDIYVSRPGKYKMVFYVEGSFCTPPENGGGSCVAGKRLNYAEAKDRDAVGKDRPRKSSASVTGIDELDIRLTKTVKTSDGRWEDIARLYYGDSVDFRLTLQLDNHGGEHTVSLEDQLSGLILETATISINGGDPEELTLRDLANWRYTIPHTRLGKQEIVFSIRAQNATMGIGTNTATAVEIGRVQNRSTQRVFVITLYRFGQPETAPCEFCKLGKISGGSSGWSNLVYARAEDKIDFRIIVGQITQATPLSLRDVLPTDNRIAYLPGTFTITENGRELEIDTETQALAFFRDGLLLSPSGTRQRSTFEVLFTGQLEAGPEFSLTNTAVLHEPETDPKSDLVSELFILTKHGQLF